MEALSEGNRVMMEGIGSMHIGWQAWIGWLMLANTASLLFAFKHVEARFIFAAFFLNGIFMTWLAGTVGYVRLLGLSHVVFWTPLLVYLALRMRDDGFDRSSLFGRYAVVLVATDAVSLVIDYIDVARYFLGESDGA